MLRRQSNAYKKFVGSLICIGLEMKNFMNSKSQNSGRIRDGLHDRSRHCRPQSIIHQTGMDFNFDTALSVIYWQWQFTPKKKKIFFTNYKFHVTLTVLTEFQTNGSLKKTGWNRYLKKRDWVLYLKRKTGGWMRYNDWISSAFRFFNSTIIIL